MTKKMKEGAKGERVTFRMESESSFGRTSSSSSSFLSTFHGSGDDCKDDWKDSLCYIIYTRQMKSIYHDIS